MKRTALLSFTLAVLLGGCANTSGTFGPTGSLLGLADGGGPQSAAGFDISPANSTILAEDLVKAMEDVIPATQSLVLIANSPTMTSALEHQLRSRGYGVEVADQPTQGGTAVPVTYAFNRFGEGQVWARLRVGALFEVSRLYHNKSGLLEPISPLTLRQLKGAEA